MLAHFLMRFLSSRSPSQTLPEPQDDERVMGAQVIWLPRAGGGWRPVVIGNQQQRLITYLDDVIEAGSVEEVSASSYSDMPALISGSSSEMATRFDGSVPSRSRGETESSHTSDLSLRTASSTGRRYPHVNLTVEVRQHLVEELWRPQQPAPSLANSLEVMRLRAHEAQLRRSAQPPAKQRGVSFRNTFLEGDWTCGRCRDHQFAKNWKCRRCGAPRSD